MRKEKNNMRFQDKVTIISGASQGFGRLAALKMFDEGAKLILNDIKEEPLREIASLTNAFYVVGDVSKASTHQELVALAQKHHGKLDLALNNAGIAHPMQRLTEIDEEVFDRQIAVNLKGVFLAMKYQIPLIEKQGGAIVNVASAAGLLGAPLCAPYVAAKHGVVGISKTAAVEGARRGVRVNAICPAFAATDMVLGGLPHMRGTPDEALARILAGAPMKRLATQEEVVQAMLWLLDPANSFVTGIALPIDGGMSAI
jgi:NAD(P)-dependent dehydrogenase (short-subunit alcohol dehydrogenase family)